jgi:hypothetical protein
MSENFLIFTRHAETMLIERGIDRAWVYGTLADPEETEPDPLRENAFHAFRAIPERGGRVLRVVYTRSEDQTTVITAFFDRAKRR